MYINRPIVAFHISGQWQHIDDNLVECIWYGTWLSPVKYRATTH